MNECKFYENSDGKFRCKCINTDICPGKACAFYITKEDADRKDEQARKRLRKLPDIQKDYIKSKYNIRF